MPGLMDISIGINPDLWAPGPFVLTWHGFLTFVAVALAVVLVAQWASKQGISTDAVYSVAVWCIVGGIIGSRLFHVQDRWDFYGSAPEEMIKVWRGGITIYGAIVGGFIAGAAYLIIRNHPRFLALWGKYFRWLGEPHRADLPSVGRMADIAAPALLITMMVGRVGDIINGEHFATTTSLPWGFVYTHAQTVALYAGSDQAQRAGITAFTPTHPAVVYEIFLDLAVLGVIWLMRSRLRPDGMLFALYGALYALGRFFISFLRLDKDWLWDLNQAQLISIAVLLITVPLLAYHAQLVRPSPPTRDPRVARIRVRGRGTRSSRT